jgi:hypothetical protein
MSHLLATVLQLQTQWILQDGARSHIADVVLNFLHGIFYSRVSQTDFLIVSHVDRTYLLTYLLTELSPS